MKATIQKASAPFYKWVVLSLPVILLAGCSTAPAVLNPASSNAQLISQLIWTTFGIAAVVFVIVEGFLIYSALRFRRGAESGLPRQVEGNPRLELAWFLAPAIVLGFVYVISLGTLRVVAYQPAVAPNDAQGNVLHVHVVGHQWWWEFDYPDLNITTANELHVPVGQTVDISLESVDVIHSFWVPELGGKIDVIPGQVNHTWFKVEKSGIFHGQCAEFCGVEHANMRFDAIAETPQQFQNWVALQQAPIPVMTGEAAKGEQTFMNGPCIGCHTINGTRAQGKVGPNLTHFASRQVFAGAILTNTPENVTAWLSDPQKIKPGNIMPNLHLAPDQISALVAYLESLK
jgi:cytochrome c oxidase subunit II